MTAGPELPHALSAMRPTERAFQCLGCGKAFDARAVDGTEAGAPELLELAGGGWIGFVTREPHAVFTVSACSEACATELLDPKASEPAPGRA